MHGVCVFVSAQMSIHTKSYGPEVAARSAGLVRNLSLRLDSKTNIALDVEREPCLGVEGKIRSLDDKI